MIKCEKCETQVPDNAKFCPKCGAPIVKQEPAEPAPAPQQAEEKPTAKSGASTFGKIFWVLFVSLGVSAYLLLDTAGLFLSLASIGFGVTLAVFAMIAGFGFCAVGIVNKVLSLKSQDKAKYAVRNNVCLAVSIILCVAVLLGAIAMFVAASNVL